MKAPALTIQVRKDMKKPSSFEDDIGDGVLGGLSRTDTVGNLVQWTPKVIKPSVTYYRLNPPPQEFESTQVEDSEDARADAERAPTFLHPRKIVHPLSKSPETRGAPFMEENEADAAAGRVDTEWPGEGAPKGFLPEWHHAQVEGGVAGAVDAGGGDVAEVSADAAIGDEDTNATETDDVGESAAAGAPALLADLQHVIVEADTSKQEYAELRTRLKKLHTKLARLDSSTEQAGARYSGFNADEVRYLDQLKSVDASGTTSAGAPSLLKKLQYSIVEADASKAEYTNLQRKLNALHRIAARLSARTGEAQARYAGFTAEELRLLDNLRSADAAAAQEDVASGDA